MSRLLPLITSQDPALRNQSLEGVCDGLALSALLEECSHLDVFRRKSENLYERVRALMFLYHLHRFVVPAKIGSSRACAAGGPIPFSGYEHLLRRRFEEAIDSFLASQTEQGPSDALCSALAAAYHRLAFQTLADQVRRSVRTVRGNQWMFRMGHPADQPLRLHPRLLERQPDGTYPILKEATPVRMDLTHCGWSDIFFLGMDYPEGARVLNVSVDLGVHGRDSGVRPPVSAWLRVIEEPVLRLTSVDLSATADIAALADVFDFAKDHLGLLKAALIAAGLVPPGVEGSGQSLEELLAAMVGPGKGLELVSCVNAIPKGSRLAVSTNLLGALISVCMRATSQATSLTGALEESERRLVLARALLGEWLGGSGGGWQDSGGVWPGMKLIEGVVSAEGDPEFGISRGRLMPQHRILGMEECPAESRRKLQESLVLVHGGMAQNVGPILEMVTEKYLMRGSREWKARQEALAALEQVLAALRSGDIQALGKATTQNFTGSIQTIIPWATNAYTERLIQEAQKEFGSDFWGFWMLGGMSGGGMGFMFAPHRKQEAQKSMQRIMSTAKQELQHALPFAMEPVVYDFAVNERGTWAELLTGESALMPPAYYPLMLPTLLRQDRHRLPLSRRAELEQFAHASRGDTELRGIIPALFDALLPRSKGREHEGNMLEQLLRENGFDPAQHEQIRSDLLAGRIGLAQNRLRADSVVEEVLASDVVDLTARSDSSECRGIEDLGSNAIANGELAIVSLAAGAGSRWTQGAGVCKALHPFCRFAGKHRTFLEVHLAKSLKVVQELGCVLPHIVTTSYLTHGPVKSFLDRVGNHGYPGPLILSPGRAVGLRLIPTERDLRFAWEEMPQQVLDEQQQKMRESLRAALIQWAKAAGEASDYKDNVPLQCLHPVGHWYEIPNLFRNGVLQQLLKSQPQIKYLLLHNIDTLGANADPRCLGQHISSGATLSFEVIERRLEDRGGGLARVNGRPRLVEGLAMPREELEFELSLYNSMTTWISVDALLAGFGLTRECLQDPERVTTAIRQLGARVPTYMTVKDVKKRWGHGQEDVFPVMQFEKLWGDFTALPDWKTQFLRVPRLRGQQLKDQAQLDGWFRDGSAQYIESLCRF